MLVLARCVTIPDEHTSLAYLESDAAFLLTAFGTAAVCCHRAFTSLLIIINPTHDIHVAATVKHLRTL